MIGLTPVSCLTFAAQRRGQLVSPPRGVVDLLPVQDQDALADVAAHVVHEERGLGLGVAAHGVMVDSGALARAHRGLQLPVRVSVHAVDQTAVVETAGAPRGADHDEVARHRGRVNAALPVADVVAVHRGQGGRRRGAEQHGDDHGDDAGQHGRLAGLASGHVPRLALVEDGHSLSFLSVGGYGKGHDGCRGQT